MSKKRSLYIESNVKPLQSHSDWSYINWYCYWIGNVFSFSYSQVNRVYNKYDTDVIVVMIHYCAVTFILFYFFEKLSRESRKKR